MKRILILPILFLTLNSFAQDFLSLSLSKTYSNFNFTNTKGEKDKTIKPVLKNAYAANYQKLFDNNLFVRGEIGIKEMGAYSVFKNQKISWNLNYFDVNVGGGFVIPINNLTTYAGVTFYEAFLINANQTIGASYFDIKKENKIKTNDFGFNAFAGVSYHLSYTTSIYLEFSKLNGINELDPDSNQKLFNKAVFFKLGFMFEFISHQKRFSTLKLF